MINLKNIINIIPIMLLLIFTMNNCRSLKGYNNAEKGLNIYIQQGDYDFSRKSIMVLNFKEPDYAKTKGKHAGLVFHKHLLNSKKFYMVSLNNNSTWYQYGKTEEEKLQTAMKEGREQNVDFIFVGEIIDYVFGGLNKTKVRVKARVIEVKTGITFFMGEYTKTDLGKDISYPLSTKLTNTSDIPNKVMNKIAKKIIFKL